MKKKQIVTILTTLFLIASIVGCTNQNSQEKLNTTAENKMDEVKNKGDEAKDKVNETKDKVNEAKDKVNESKDKLTNIIKFNNEDGIDFSKLEYIPSETQKDEKLEAAFSKVYQIEKGKDEVKYYYNKIDLNNDGKQEIFVFLAGPAVSGSGGGSAAIFETNKDEYKLISNFTLVHTPIIISKNKTNGWNDIIMDVSGGGGKSFYADIKHGDKEYPSNPSVQPAVKSGTVVEGTAIIAEDIMNTGIKF